MIRRLLFTTVFTIFGFIFYALLYTLLDMWFPGEWEAPASMNGPYFTKITLLFTAVILLAYWGAAAVLHGGKNRGPDQD